MKCREVQSWLYSFRTESSCPTELIGHLQLCQQCQRLQAHLRQIDQEVHKVTSVAPSGDGKKQLLNRLLHTPQTYDPQKVTLQIPRTWFRAGMFCSSAAALILFGWFLPHSDAPIKSANIVDTDNNVRTVEAIRDKEVIRVNSSAEEQLFAALIKLNVDLVRADDAEERLETLLDMAHGCRNHALMLAEKGPYDHLPVVVNMYSRFLHEGALVQLQQAPKDTHAELRDATRTRLQEMAQLPALPVKTLPKAIEDQLDALESAAKQSIVLLDRAEGALTPLKSLHASHSESVHGTTALVRFAIAVSNETDPIAKSEICAECVHQLMPCVLLYLSDDANPLQSELGLQFGELIRYGVYAPLHAAREKDPSPKTVEKTDLILKRTSEAVKKMELCFHKTPDAKRAGFEHALQSSKKGLERIFQAAKKSNEKNSGRKSSFSNRFKKGKGFGIPGPFKKNASAPSPVKNPRVYSGESAQVWPPAESEMIAALIREDWRQTLNACSRLSG